MVCCHTATRVGLMATRLMVPPKKGSSLINSWHLSGKYCYDTGVRDIHFHIEGLNQVWIRNYESQDESFL